MTNLSQWFLLSEQTPWEVGVYEVHIGLRFSDGIKEAKEQFQEWFAFWDGSQFSLSTGDIYRAENMKSVQEGSDVGVFKWRGLSTNSEVKKKENKRKTMYVIMKAISNSPVASFSNVNAARDYAGRVNFPVRIRRIRFRTSE